MTSLPSPRLSRRFHLSLVWVVPLVAAVVAGGMLYRYWRDRGPEITIRFADGAGVRAGQTMLQYKGVAVGTVADVHLRQDLQEVEVTVRLRREARELAREGSRFWIVHPQVGFSGVSGLETLVAGVHLDVRPGNGPRRTSFRGLDQPPAPAALGEGPAFLLLTDRLGTMQPGAPVYYREFQVGEVENIELGENAQTVRIRVRVRKAYTNLVRRNTEFWNAGGVPVQFSLFGAQVETASFRSFFTGAIAFATPDTTAEPAPENTPFRLHAAPEEEWRLWHPRIPITVPNVASPPTPDSLPELLSDSNPEG